MHELRPAPRGFDLVDDPVPVPHGLDCYRRSALAARQEGLQRAPLMLNLFLAEELAVRLGHRRQRVALVRIERDILHGAAPPCSPRLPPRVFCLRAQDTLRAGGAALSYHQNRVRVLGRSVRLGWPNTSRVEWAVGEPGGGRRSAPPGRAVDLREGLGAAADTGDWGAGPGGVRADQTARRT